MSIIFPFVNNISFDRIFNEQYLSQNNNIIDFQKKTANQSYPITC